MSDESREVARIKQTGLLVAPGLSGAPDWWVAAYGPHCLYRSSLDPDKPEERRELLAALSEESTGKDHYLNTDLRIVHFTVTPASREEGGELHEWVRTILHLEDGTRIAFGSSGILKSLNLIQILDRPAPWRPPIVKRLVQRQLGNGRNWIQLVDPPAAKAGKK